MSHPRTYFHPKRFRKFLFEFLSIFVAVIAAFGLNRWNDNRKDALAEQKILREIDYGLEKDLSDMQVNMLGHRQGMRAADYWRSVLKNDPVSMDSLGPMLFNLTRDFVSIQNTSGYQSLKSRGLELVKDDSLRTEIIHYYEFDLKTLEKIEEQYAEAEFYEHFNPLIDELVAPALQFNERGGVVSINLPLDLSEGDRARSLYGLWRISLNRHFLLGQYDNAERSIDRLRGRIQQELATR